MKTTIEDEKDGRCQTCQHCKRIAERGYRTYCFAPLLNEKGKRRTPFEVHTHFKCSNGMYKFYEF